MNGSEYSTLLTYDEVVCSMLDNVLRLLYIAFDVLKEMIKHLYVFVKKNYHCHDAALGLRHDRKCLIFGIKFLIK